MTQGKNSPSVSAMPILDHLEETRFALDTLRTEKYGGSWQAMSDATGVRVDELQKWYRGVRTPTDKQLRKIGWCYGQHIQTYLNPPPRHPFKLLHPEKKPVKTKRKK